MLKRFYIYALIDPRDDAPFYIGKGSGKRLFDDNRRARANPHFKHRAGKIQEAGKEIVRQVWFESGDEPSCYWAEMWVIRCLRSQGVALCNLNDGGVGGVNPSEEIRRKLGIYGEKNSNSRFTESDILEISRLREQGLNQMGISKMLGVSQSWISRITSRKVWAHLELPRAKPIRVDVEKIFKLRQEGLPQSEIAKLFQVSQGYISQILSGRYGKHNALVI